LTLSQADANKHEEAVTAALEAQRKKHANELAVAIENAKVREWIDPELRQL
jgi:hypothetical protein